MVRLITVCALVIAAWPPVAAAQEASSSLEALFRARELRRGVGIYVTDETGQRIKATVSDLRDSVRLLAHPGRGCVRRRHGRCHQAQDALRGCRRQARDGGTRRIARRTQRAGIHRVVSLDDRCEHGQRRAVGAVGHGHRAHGAIDQLASRWS